MAFGDGRRKTLNALKSKETLEPLENPDSIEEVIEAIREVSCERVMNPEEDMIQRLKNVYNDLPEDAQREYVTDRVLLRRINAMRRRFNEWKGKSIRSKRMPSWAEAGPSKYPHKKAKKLQRYERNGHEELQEAKDGVRAAIKGTKQRALNAVGSSIAEHNAAKAKSEREIVRDALEVGQIVQFRNPRIEIGRVIRVNKKTVTVEYERGYTEDPLTGEELDPMAQTRVKLDSNWLTILTDAETIQEAKGLQEADGSEEN